MDLRVSPTLYRAKLCCQCCNKRPKVHKKATCPHRFRSAMPILLDDRGKAEGRPIGLSRETVDGKWFEAWSAE